MLGECFKFVESPKIAQKVILLNASTVKPEYNSHPWDPQKVAVVHRWSLCRGFSIKITVSIEILGITLAVLDRWPLFRGGR